VERNVVANPQEHFALQPNLDFLPKRAEVERQPNRVQYLGQSAVGDLVPALVNLADECRG
jgi:hypothetical protein